MTARHLRRRLGAAAAATSVSLVLLVPTNAQATVATTGSALAARPAAGAARVVGNDTADLATASWWRDAMDVDEMQRTATGKGITVAVIDGPFNDQVPELKGKFTAESTCATAPAQTTDAIASHGTSMAALIGGTGKGTVAGNGVRGIAPDARLRGYTIATEGGFRKGDLSCGAAGNSVGDAIDAAVEDGAKILSMSVGAADDTSTAAIGRAQRAGAIVVAATDDHDKVVGYPGSANGVLSVNAVDRQVQLAPFSAAWEYKNDIATASPGMGVNSIYRTKNGWTSAGRADGSSPAAAIVAGGLALVWSHFPDAKANQIIQLMVNTPGVKVAKGKDGRPGFFTSFRRSGEGLPHGDTKTGYGFGVFDPADMLKGDPSTYPDVNPFLDPAAGFKPTYQEVTGKAPSSAATQPPTSATTTPSSAPSSSAATKADSVSTQDDGGTPPWIWVGLGLVVLVMAGVGFGVLRGRGTTTDSREGN